MNVIVVGAGVIGASIAYHLARAGADVTVVSSGAPAASQSSFGWINASFYADTPHHTLRASGIAAYARLMGQRPDLPVAMTGALWWEKQGAELTKMQRDLAALNYPVALLSKAKAEALEPDLRGLPQKVLHFGGEGAAEVGDLATALLAASGAHIIFGVQATGLIEQNGAIMGVETTAGTLNADHVVVAAGNGAPDLLASVGLKLPMLTRPGVLVTTKPVRAKITSVLVTPHGEVRQLPDGRILASGVANHQGDDASTVTEPPKDIAARVLAWLSPMIDAPLDWDRVALADRPVPADGLPVIGPIGPRGLHVAVMHSGVTLAAIVGEVTADTIMGQGDHNALLSPYRPQRFQ